MNRRRATQTLFGSSLECTEKCSQLRRRPLHFGARVSVGSGHLAFYPCGVGPWMTRLRASPASPSAPDGVMACSARRHRRCRRGWSSPGLPGKPPGLPRRNGMEDQPFIPTRADAVDATQPCASVLPRAIIMSNDIYKPGSNSKSSSDRQKNSHSAVSRLESMLSVRQVAEILNHSERHIRDLADDGIIPGSKATGRWRFHPRDIERLVRPQ
jgi:hypothetical protein